MSGVSTPADELLETASRRKPGERRPRERKRQARTTIDAHANGSADLHGLEAVFDESFDALPDAIRHELAIEIAKTQARDMASDVVARALREADAPSLRTIQKAVGIDPSQVSKISVGALDEGPHLWTLCRIALALRKRLVISFE